MVAFFRVGWAGALALVWLCAASPTSAQAPAGGPPPNWFNLDEATDGVRGVSTERAYRELLQGRTPQPVIVAVIDGGVQLDHPDLQPQIWVNPKETPGNRTDDDANGYADDVNGWNFLGGPDGRSINGETLELTREYNRLQPKYAVGPPTGKNAKKLKAEYEYYERVRMQFEEERERYSGQLAQMKQLYDVYVRADSVAKSVLGPGYTPAQVMAQTLLSDAEPLAFSQRVFGYFQQQGFSPSELVDYYKNIESRVLYNYNPNHNPRALVVGDNPDVNDGKPYGNNDAQGPDPSHGTHVAGIIGAVRDNELGVKGVAPTVRIMVLRAVPDGDERDKDVANAIRYAVDNGARIINMSFGKALSPQRDLVAAAVAYATQKGVLMVHAAGNDSQDNDVEPSYPTRHMGTGKALGQNPSPLWIEVGALSWDTTSGWAANFSNYGQKSVDVFAPGVDVYSTIPGSGYGKNSGTSMAAPVVSGVAALVMAYFPELSATQVKDILLSSAVRYPASSLMLPSEEDGPSTEVPLSRLCSTGGMVNAYAAVKLAQERSGK